jgi:2-haloacid dehalogenase
MPIKVCVFAAYGTLFDVAGAARAAAEEPGRAVLKEHWPRLAEIWRAKQLEYSWIRAIAEEHTDFWTVTCDALDYAMAVLKLDDNDLKGRLRELYLHLPAYPEVPAMLDMLNTAERKCAILSNGSPDMLGAAVKSAGIENRLEAVLSVEQVGVFKPHRRVYDLVGQTFGVERGEVLFVSSNGWDAAAAEGYGFEVLWVNRNAMPVDRLPWKPHRQARNLSAVPAMAATL